MLRVVKDVVVVAATAAAEECGSLSGLCGRVGVCEDAVWSIVVVVLGGECGSVRRECKDCLVVVGWSV